MVWGEIPLEVQDYPFRGSECPSSQEEGLFLSSEGFLSAEGGRKHYHAVS